jgi:hypothetical protein
VEIVLRSAKGTRFVFFGSINQIPGKSADTNGDNIVTAQEIDGAPGSGNGSGSLDTEAERRYINSINVSLSVDKNMDGKPDFSTELRIRPPLLMVNRRV